MYKKKKCDLCNSTKIKILVDLKSPSLTSDRRVIDIPLKKFQCTSCGLVFGWGTFKEKNIIKHYKKEYLYNPSIKGDAVFFTTSGSQERSSQIFEWILENIPYEHLKKSETIIEVGCGQGNLLLKFQERFPKKTIIGFELNQDAILLGKKRGLDIRKLSELENINSDIIITYAVIEHTRSPKIFLKDLAKHLNPGGLLVLGQPHQDNIYYDIFFNDHLYHFSSKHIEEYGRLVNLKQIKKSIGRWPIDSFSLHIFKKSFKLKQRKVSFHKTKVKKSLEYYLKIFEKINVYLKNVGINREIAVFGLGELFSLFYCHSNLKNAKIKYGIDDFPKRNHNFNFKIISSQKAKSLNDMPIIFCINKNYYDIVLKKIQKERDQVFLPFKE